MSGFTTELNGLREKGQMTWREREHAWVGSLEEILHALAADGYDECKREMTTSQRDCRPSGGVWQGVNPRTGSVAAAIWVARPIASQALVFLQIDGAAIARPGRAPDEEEGGQG
ncbi:MAG: hypothetical protein HYY95_05345 [Candidatus Rokubacteria bacterium]|nr:hypothetical protein [Candidatus Rokubacteria bacterium]